VHVSSGAGVALVAEARARGLDVTCETCPHYLVLTEDDAERIGALAKCAPPLRSVCERESLWKALAGGKLPMIASDHSPAPDDLKEGDDLFAVWGGIAGAQTMLALVLDEGLSRGLPLATLADRLAGFPARRFRLAGKGRLEPGADADIALVRAGDWMLEAADLRSRYPLSPFLGRTLHHRVVRTLLRGRTIASGGNLTGPAAGRLVRPA
jgi:allantoinase